MCMPLTFPSETEQRYLKETTNIFKDRKESGLTDQTFLACIQTKSAVSVLPNICMKSLDFTQPMSFDFT